MTNLIQFWHQVGKRGEPKLNNIANRNMIKECFEQESYSHVKGPWIVMIISL